MGQNRPAKRKKRRAKQPRGKHSSENVDPARAPDLDLDSASAAQKKAVQRQCQAHAQAPKEVPELYGAFLCSRVFSEGGMEFVHPLYADQAHLHSTQRPPFAPTTPSSLPATTEGSISSLEVVPQVARLHGPTPSERHQAQRFAEQYQGGLLNLCLTLSPRDLASEDPDDTIWLPPFVEELSGPFRPETSVHIVSGAGTRFTGVLPVDYDTCYVFDPTCGDAVISDSMATGGVVVCYGRGCHVTFSNCHFADNASIVVLAGASVTLTGCTFICPRFNAVFAHACGTCVTVESCFFGEGGHPVSVAGGASVTVTGSTFDRSMTVAMVVRDKGSLLKAQNCKVRGVGPGTLLAPEYGAPQAPSRGVLVLKGARLELRSTDITRVGCGVTVCQRSTAVLTGCSVATATEVAGPVAEANWPPSRTRFCVQSADSNVKLSRCVLKGEEKKDARVHGVCANDSSVKLQGCTVLGNSAGVALYHSTGVLADCKFENSVVTSVMAAEQSSLDMRACVCNLKGSAKYGVGVMESDCRLEGVTVAGTEVGFRLHFILSYSVLADCKAMDVTGQGLLVSGAGHLVRVQGFEMRGAAQQQEVHGTYMDPVHGIAVQDAGRADLDNCKLAAGPGGIAVLAEGEGAELWGEDCQMSGGMGASAREGAQMTLRRCATHECVTKGYSAWKRAVLNLHNCTSTGDCSGFYCREQGRLHAQDCEVRGFSGGAVVISENCMGGATCKLDRCRFVDPEPSPAERSKNDVCGCGCTPFPAGVGVYVKGKGAHVSMHGCTVSGTVYDCVSVTDQAKATLEGCQLSHSNKGCVGVTYQAKATLEGCQLSHSKQDGVACAERGSEVFLDGCNISSSERRALLCCRGGRVVARRVHSCGNKRGGFTLYGECNMTLKECSSDRDYIGCVARGHHTHISEAEQHNVIGTARVVLSGVLVRRSSESGFFFDSYTRGCMKHCAALQCGHSGMYMVPRAPGEPLTSGSALGLSVFDSTFERCSYGGVTVQEGCSVSMQNVLCSRSKGHGFGCFGIGSRLLLKGCEVEGGGDPYQCEEGGKLRRIECRPAGPCMRG